MEQPPDDSVHEDGLNVPPVFPSLHDTVPVVIVVEFEVSITVTVNLPELPEDIVKIFGEIDRVVE